MMEYYIKASASFDDIKGDIKELIPAPEMRRRMSRVVKMGVATAMECLSGLSEGETVDAIITGTGLGCLADSEKFLRNVIDNSEQMLNPTPFMQSTFNTVGAAVGLLLKNHCYNMTYVHRGHSFESALLDAFMRIELDGAQNVLVGAFDESTPTQRRIMERMGMWRRRSDGEGAHFFVLSCAQGPDVQARLRCMEFSDPKETAVQAADRLGLENPAGMWDDCGEGCYHTMSARSLYQGVGMIRNGARTVIVRNTYPGGAPSLMVLECI